MIRVKQSFSNSIYLEFMQKKDNSSALLLSAVFENALTRWLPNGVLKQDLLDVSAATSFVKYNFEKN